MSKQSPVSICNPKMKRHIFSRPQQLAAFRPRGSRTSKNLLCLLVPHRNAWIHAVTRCDRVMLLFRVGNLSHLDYLSPRLHGGCTLKNLTTDSLTLSGTIDGPFKFECAQQTPTAFAMLGVYSFRKSTMTGEARDEGAQVFVAHLLLFLLFLSGDIHANGGRRVSGVGIRYDIK